MSTEAGKERGPKVASETPAFRDHPPDSVEPRPERVDDAIEPILRVFVLACHAGMQPLLRPSAHRELGRFVGHLQTQKDVIAFLTWAQHVLRAHRRDAHGASPKSAARLVRNAPKGMFVRPELAYRPRRLYSR